MNDTKNTTDEQKKSIAKVKIFNLTSKNYSLIKHNYY